MVESLESADTPMREQSFTRVLTRYFTGLGEFDDEDEEVKVGKTIEAAEKLLPGGIMSDWLREWCTFDRALLYLRGRKGNVEKAADILAKALIWRQEHEDILNGARVPRWTGDMRVLALGEMGHPIVYACTGNKAGDARATDEIEHAAAVLEAAAGLMAPDVSSLDAVFDCHGFLLTNFLDPRPAVALAEMLKHPYRGILRTGVIIDAPWSFSAVWNVFYPVLPTATRDKIKFLTHGEASEYLQCLVGVDAATALDLVMAGNRSVEGGVAPTSLPSEAQPLHKVVNAEHA